MIYLYVKSLVKCARDIFVNKFFHIFYVILFCLFWRCTCIHPSIGVLVSNWIQRLHNVNDLKMILRAFLSFLHNHRRCENFFLPHNYFEKWYVKTLCHFSWGFFCESYFWLPSFCLFCCQEIYGLFIWQPFGKKFPVFKIHWKIGLQKFLWNCRPLVFWPTKQLFTFIILLFVETPRKFITPKLSICKPGSVVFPQTIVYIYLCIYIYIYIYVAMQAYKKLNLYYLSFVDCSFARSATIGTIIIGSHCVRLKTFNYDTVTPVEMPFSKMIMKCGFYFEVLLPVVNLPTDFRCCFIMIHSKSYCRFEIFLTHWAPCSTIPLTSRLFGIIHK